MSGNMYGADSHKSRYHWSDQESIPDSTSSLYSTATTRIGDDRPLATDIGQRVLSLLTEQLYTDVKFVVNCGIKPKPYLLAHKAILAVGSSKFAEMLYKNEDVVDEIGRTVEIQINHIPFKAFRSVVEFLYTDDVYFENDTKVIETLSAAKMLEVQPLVDRCESYLESSELTEESVCTRLQLATTHKLESLKTQCMQFIEENTDAVLRSSDFKDCQLSTIRTICKMQKLNLSSEQILFKGVLDWVQEQNNQEVTRNVVEPLLRHIRFLTMRCDEFSQMVKRHPDLFTANEALSIVMYLSDPNPNKSTSNLPSWCNKGHNRCIKASQRHQLSRRMERKISICLKPTKRGHLSNLLSLLELKCTQGLYQITALKLSFGEPVTPQSYIGALVVTVTVEPSKFVFKEHVKIHNSVDVSVPLTRSLFVRGKQTVYFRAEASGVRNYNFLQFDEDNSFSEESPFECSLGSFPKNDRLYFISEVIYERVSSRTKNKRNPK